LEALKEAIRPEVTAITREMFLKVMDNYRKRLHKIINIQGRHLSDVLFITHKCKTAFCVLSRNRKTFAVSSLILNLFASQIGEFFLPHSIHITLDTLFVVSIDGGANMNKSRGRQRIFPSASLKATCLPRGENKYNIDAYH